MKLYIIKLLSNLITSNFIFFLFYLRFRLRLSNTKKKHGQISVINTYDKGGGAAKVASQLSQNLQGSFSIHFYVKMKKTNEDWISEINTRKYNFLEEVLRREAVNKGWIEFTGFHALSLLKDTFFTSSSIVHLHNLHGEFFSPVLFKSLFEGKKVIWTLHDESFITGHCSCTLGCNRWQTGCGSCPDLTIYPPTNFDNTKKVLRYKKKWITALQPIVVCPSHWLADRVRFAYPDLKSIEVIPNGIDTEVFYPKNKLFLRELLGLPVDKKIVLFVAEFATLNPFKGGDILRDIITDITFSDVIFVTVGGKHESSIQNHICYPYIEDKNELANLYAACDLLLYPTQADNLPLVVLESMACGTPVIASNLGGIPEIIINQKYGFLVDDFKVSLSFKNVLFNYFELSEENRSLIQSNVRERVVLKFSLQIMVDNYKELYLK